MNEQTQTYRFYVDIDASTDDKARDELIEQMAAYPLIDMPFEIQKSQQISIDELVKHLNVEKHRPDFNDINKHFCEYDAWLCLHCRDDVGNDLGDMIDHLRTHTIEELKLTEDGDPFDE